MFCQGQAFPTKKKPDWFSKKAKRMPLKKPEFQNLASKKPNFKFATLHQPIYFTLGVANLSSTGINQKISS